MKPGFLQKIAGLAASVLLLISSCRKDDLHPGNTRELEIAGTVNDLSTNQPIAGQQVTVTLHSIQYCILCTPYKLASGQTDENGRFLIPFSLDSGLLKDHYLQVSVPPPSGYLLYPVSSDSFYRKVSLSALTHVFSGTGTQPDSMQNLRFGFYASSPLQIHLHRRSAINPVNPYLLLSFSIAGSNTSSSLMFNQSEANKDTTLNINTSSLLSTKISWSKYKASQVPSSGEQPVEQPVEQSSGTDSITCTPQGNSWIDINY